MTNLKELEKTGRKAWLATIGTYAKGWEIISGKVTESFEETSQFVNELIDNGEKIEADLKEKIASNTILDDKITELKAKLGVDLGTEEKLEQLAKKVNLLTAEVEKLVALRAEQAAKAPIKKATTKTTATKKATPKAETAPKSVKTASVKTTAKS